MASRELHEVLTAAPASKAPGQLLTARRNARGCVVGGDRGFSFSIRNIATARWCGYYKQVTRQRKRRMRGFCFLSSRPLYVLSIVIGFSPK